MAQLHGMSPLEGFDALCDQNHVQQDGDRFGRLFQHLAPLTLPVSTLKALGAPNGPMDGGVNAHRTASVPVGHVFFGQFIDHDITLDITSSFTSVANDIGNARTPTLDLDCVYGMGPEANPYFFYASGEFAGIKLMTGVDELLARQARGEVFSEEAAHLLRNDLHRSVEGRAMIGDFRNDENRIVSQMQLAMIRFHNNIVEELSDDLHGHELYEEARRLATWHYQWAVIHDFLVKMCGQAVVSDILGNGRRFYCTQGQTPYIPVEFSVAAYRFGHSMIPQKIQVQKGANLFELFGRKLGRGFSPLDDPDAIVDWFELVDNNQGRNVQMAEKLDSKMASDLLALPFIPEAMINSLPTRNLMRGQAFLLPSGENIAAAMGRDTTEITSVSQAAQTIAGAGIDLNSGTPLWFYLLAEAETLGRETTAGQFEPGEGLGPVGARIVAETLIGLIELDGRSYLANNRNWDPQDGINAATLGEILAFSQA